MAQLPVTEVDLVRAAIADILERRRHENKMRWPLVERAIILSEDRRFFRHPGVDLLAIFRAAFAFLTQGTVSGASTIEQQLVRTIRGRYERTLQRKLSEIVIAIVVARYFSKTDIVLAYLEIAYFGWNATGLKHAIRRFGIDVSVASVEDAAMIAALLKLPMPKSPSEEYHRRLTRRTNHIVFLLERDTH